MIIVDLLRWMGDDLAVVNAARVSFDKQSDWENAEYGHPDFEEPYYLSERDTKLIKYLAKHKHISPFGHCFASFRVKAPVAVARQLVKHKFLRWNEISRRYVKNEPECFLPDIWRTAPENSKQGSGGPHDNSDNLSAAAQDLYAKAVHMYNAFIELGVAPEQARLVLPQAMYTEWYWSGSLDAFAAMCKLRCASDTQQESRIVAQEISDHMLDIFPVSWAALMEY